ncbi:hypothetical protein CBL_06446 [Carabus blaptoides fortunei]
MSSNREPAFQLCCANVDWYTHTHFHESAIGFSPSIVIAVVNIHTHTYTRATDRFSGLHISITTSPMSANIILLSPVIDVQLQAELHSVELQSATVLAWPAVAKTSCSIVHTGTRQVSEKPKG